MKTWLRTLFDPIAAKIAAKAKTKRIIDEYRAIAAFYQGKSEGYKADLYDSWKVITAQNKGLVRQARKIKRLKAIIAKMEGKT